MAISINGQIYYRTSEACRMAYISRATLFRWLKSGILKDAMLRDRNGWRLFTLDDINRIKTEVTRASRQETQLEVATTMKLNDRPIEEENDE